MPINEDLVYRIALTMVPQVGSVHARALAEALGSAEAIFKAPPSLLEKIDGIGAVRARSIRNFNSFARAEKEIRFIEKYQIHPLFIGGDDYPQRLLNCYDPPTLLYFKGTADLNAPKIISVVGTRNNTTYGKQVTETLIRGLQSYQPVVISGLAFGIDSVAHRAALKFRLSTIAVLAHGLKTIYPPENESLARQIVQGGGLLTEFMSDMAPDKHNFPSRNRIVAGLADATILVETGTRGGSIITADLANNYNRDVFAVPGKIQDTRSQGCNMLIRQNRAVLLDSPEQLAETLGWKELPQINGPRQIELWTELSQEEKIITSLLREKEKVAIDELLLKSRISAGQLSSILLSLEIKNVIESCPGNTFRLIS